jgi:hypothetical protein
MSRKSTALVPPRHLPDTTTWWDERDVAFEVTTRAASRKVEQRDLQCFAECMRIEDQTDWRSWSDPTIHRLLSHVKTFVIGNPVNKLTLQPPGMGLEIEWTLTASKPRQLLDTADLLVEIGGPSTDRLHHCGITCPNRNGYRALWTLAIIDTLVETGMRRGAPFRDQPRGAAE